MQKLPVLAINIDGVVRNFLDRFDKQYRKVFIFNPALVAMDSNTMTMRDFTPEELEERQETIKQKEKELITLPVKSSDLLNHYKFDETILDMLKNDPNKMVIGSDEAIKLTPHQTLDRFLEDYAFQLYGDAEAYDGAAEAVNKIQYTGLSNNLFETVLVSTLKGRAIPPTYFFLGKVVCKVRKVIFLENDEQKWEIADAVIDSSPETLQIKPAGKKSIKINHEFNEWDNADFNFNTLRQVANDKTVFQHIFNNKDAQ